MKVSLCIRKDAELNPGGDWVQLERTAQALRERGMTVEMCVGSLPTAPDVVHAFNMTRITNTLRVARWAKQRAVPLVISPIWHSLPDMARFYGDLYSIPAQWFPIRGYLAVKELMYERELSGAMIASVLHWGSVLRSVVRSASMLLPNSPQEWDQLQRDLQVTARAVKVVPNAVDLEVSFNGAYEREQLIVCPGRIEPRKNQARIIEAFKDSSVLKDWKLILLGRVNERHRGYFDRVRALVDGKRVVWMDHVSYREAQQLYARSRVLVLASHFETTGLVGLEGLYQGCNVVMTERCYNDFYYGDRVEYCDPYQVHSIRHAMERALLRPEPSLEAEYFRKFSWAHVGDLTVNAYRELAAGRMS